MFFTLKGSRRPWAIHGPIRQCN